MKTYITKSKSIKIKELENNNFSLSPWDFRILKTVNKNIITVENIVDYENVWEQIDVINYLSFKTDYSLWTISWMKGIIYDEKSNWEYISPNLYNNSLKKLSKWEIIISRNATLGKASYINKEIKCILNWWLTNLYIEDKIKRFYFLWFSFSKYLSEQLKFTCSWWWTQQNAKRQDVLNLKIPFPSKNNNPEPEKVEKLISFIVQNLIDKEEQIKRKNILIDEMIEMELRENQKEWKIFDSKKYIKISDIFDKWRLDSDIFSEKVREVEFITENYINWFSNISDNFNYCRWQNLQVSQIWESYYSNSPKKNFYRIFTNIEMQDNRTISWFRYIWNKNKLTTLPENWIMLAADWMIVWRSFFFDKMENTITNIHPWVITAIKKDTEQYKSVFLSLYLSYLKNIWYLAKIKDKANWWWLKKIHLDKWIKIPNFPDLKQKEIAKEYYNKVEKNCDLGFGDYLEKEKERNEKLWIFQLNMEIFELREVLENLVDKVVLDKKIEINFEY